MAATKCNNCGAKIPKEAQFCPGCGAPKPAVQQAPQQTQPAPQQMQTMSKPMVAGSNSMQGLLNTIFSKKFIILGVCLGILLIWIGIVIGNFSIGYPYTDMNFYGPKFAGTINSLGFAILAIALIGGGIQNRRIDKFVRMGMVFGGTLSLGLALDVSLWTILGNLASAFS